MRKVAAASCAGYRSNNARVVGATGKRAPRARLRLAERRLRCRKCGCQKQRRRGRDEISKNESSRGSIRRVVTRSRRSRASRPDRNGRGSRERARNFRLSTTLRSNRRTAAGGSLDGCPTIPRRVATVRDRFPCAQTCKRVTRRDTRHNAVKLAFKCRVCVMRARGRVLL